MSGASRILSGVCGIYRETLFTDDGAFEWLYTTFIGFKNPWKWTYKTVYGKVARKKFQPEFDVRIICTFVKFMMKTR
jgi:hypothetical protein